MDENICSISEVETVEIDVSDFAEEKRMDNVIDMHLEETERINQREIVTLGKNCPVKEQNDDTHFEEQVTKKTNTELIFDSLNYECKPVEFLRIGSSNEEEKKPLLNLIERNNDAVELVWLDEFIRKMKAVDTKAMNKPIPEARDDYEIKRIWKHMYKCSGERNFLSMKYKKVKSMKFDEHGRLMSQSVNKKPVSPSLNMDDARHILYVCVVQLLAQVGFYACEESAIVILADILEDYIKRMCKLLCYNRDREMLDGPTGFSDIFIRSLHEMGIADINDIPRYYEENIRERKTAERDKCLKLIHRFQFMKNRKEIIKEVKESLKAKEDSERKKVKEDTQKIQIKQEALPINHTQIKEEHLSDNESRMEEESLSDEDLGAELDYPSDYERLPEEEYVDEEMEEEEEVDEEAEEEEKEESEEEKFVEKDSDEDYSPDSPTVKKVATDYVPLRTSARGQKRKISYSESSFGSESEPESDSDPGSDPDYELEE